ncbi:MULTISPECIES: DUF2732 family protein [Providencia]|uniref:DUF2732 family protein n=1 Tax=Providencia TaxID=586 RepID=UPI000DE6C107|nr:MULTISPECIES: DUF2732 family protein [Providencia]SST02794.1 Protein of uncharacterised function (DUF2732) [Acinetobacter baumannii]MDQ5989806.1 DUF2732 family protein [Providencia stuartii]MDT7048729.1 DUF2732 family protein [Providencia stuartii]QIC16460.1 DUF2732 family protein [Providencia vermicola]RMA08732.1 DUF2732 family protein [Providencia stuartii]
MKNIEIKPILVGVDLATGERDYSAVAVSIHAIREDERKTLLDKFSSRIDSLACKAVQEKMSYSEVYQLLAGEAERLSNEAAELNHV